MVMTYYPLVVKRSTWLGVDEDKDLMSERFKDTSQRDIERDAMKLWDVGGGTKETGSTPGFIH